MKERLNILDIWVDPVNMREALTRIEAFIERGGRPHTVFAVNPEKNFSVPLDQTLYQAFRDADLLIPDGIGVVTAVRLLYSIRLERVPGVELMAHVCGLAARKGYGVFIYGSREEVSAGAAGILKERYPGLLIVGRANGYLNGEEQSRLVDRINASGAQILFLALGSPKQERWLAENRGELKTIAGTVKRAPEMWCRLGLEWLYRLISEPKRLRRQLVLPVFAWRVIQAKLHSR